MLRISGKIVEIKVSNALILGGHRAKGGTGAPLAAKGGISKSGTPVYKPGERDSGILTYLLTVSGDF